MMERAQKGRRGRLSRGITWGSRFPPRSGRSQSGKRLKEEKEREGQRAAHARRRQKERLTNNATTTEAGSGGDTGDVKAGDGISEGVASSALGNIVKTDAL